MQLRTDEPDILNKLADENITLYATPDSSPSWGWAGDVLAWYVSTEEPAGLHVRIDIRPVRPEDSYDVRQLVREAIAEAHLARCVVCGEVDREHNFDGIEAGGVVYSVHDWCTPVYVYEPGALQYLANHYHEVPGVWGWDSEGGFVGIRDLDLIQEFLDARGIQYMTG